MKETAKITGITKNKITDSPEQSAAIQASLKQNMLIVAGAGSGKTYTMTRRVINLIEMGVAPESILGLTFTNKAASELLSRVSNAVNQHRNNSSNNNSISNLFMKPEVMTYDAFFQSIVRQYGLLVGFDHNTQPLSEAGARELIKPLIGDYFQKHPEDIRWYNWDALINDVLALSSDIACSMIGVNSKGESLDSIASAVYEAKKWNTAFINCLCKVLKIKHENNSSYQSFSDATRENNDIEKAKNIAEFAKKPICRLSRTKKDTDETYKNKCSEYAKKYVDYLNSTLPNTYNESCKSLYESAVKRDILLNLVLEFDAAKQRANMAQFSDFTIAAYRLVTHFPSIAANYRRQYKYVLLDEYQDTSTTQAMLITALFHKLNTENTVESDTRIAAVGDPFQAIYSFRGASSGAFRKFYDTLNLNEDCKYSLTVTRRNAKIILAAANSITHPLRIPPVQHSSSLASEVAVTRLNSAESSSLGTLGVLKLPTQYQEIESVVRFAKYVKNTKLADNDRTDTKSPRLAVLLRSKTNISLYEQALQKAGLRTITVGYSAMLEKPEIKDVLALLKVVDDHSKTSELMRLCATARFSLSTSDLEAAANIATAANTEYIFRALVQAGLVDANIPKSQFAKVVREKSQQDPQAANIRGGVFLADVFIKAYEENEERESGINAVDSVGSAGSLDSCLDSLRNCMSEHGFASALRLGGMINAVDCARHDSLHEIIRAAVETLQVDIDVAVANALSNSESTSDSLLADMRSSFDALLALSDSYVQEMGDFTAPTLHGFIQWLNSLGSVKDSPVSLDDPADVVLMTVHQSKGLEWPAVAIVGLNDGAFPSSQGDELKVSRNESEGKCSYNETAYAAISIASKVPVPLRVDADILPRFPHNADLETSMNPEISLADFKSAEQFDEEVYGSRASDLVDIAKTICDKAGIDESDLPDEIKKVCESKRNGSLPLSQSQERGRALHADERHLMYVALTRAKFAALLTCSANTSMALNDKGSTKKSSVFWDEVYDSADNGDVKQELFSQNKKDSCVKITIGDDGGYILGDYCDDLVKILSQPSSIPEKLETTSLAWPSSISDGIREALKSSAKCVLEGNVLEGNLNEQNVLNDKSSYNNPLLGESELNNSLLIRAKELAEDNDIMPKNWNNNDWLQSKVEKLNDSGRLPVTALQRRVDLHADNNKSLPKNQLQNNQNIRLRNEWMALIRPIPRIVSPEADLGTRFHAWAEQFVKAGCVFAENFETNSEETYSLGSTWKNIVQSGVELKEHTDLQKNMINDLDVEKSLYESHLNDDFAFENDESLSRAEISAQKKLLLWESRLVKSRWAFRRPLSAEQPIVAHVNELGNRIINGKIDAVFAGGLDTKDKSKLYTVVDWKTGHKPTKADDIERKLAQLDWYRLLLSLITNAPLEAIDATLYYVDVEDESGREIHAESKSREEIISQLRNTPEFALKDDEDYEDSEDSENSEVN